MEGFDFLLDQRTLGYLLGLTANGLCQVISVMERVGGLDEGYASASGETVLCAQLLSGSFLELLQIDFGIFYGKTCLADHGHVISSQDHRAEW